MNGVAIIMASNEKLPTNLKILLEMKNELFEKLVADIQEMYRNGRFKMTFIESAFNMSLPNEDQELLMKKIWL